MSVDTELIVTVDDLEGMPEDGNKYEVVGGELYVSTAPGFPHQSALARLFSAMDWYLKDHPSGRLLWNLGLVFNKLNGVVPDLVYITNERLARILEGGRLTAAPEIVVEALSPGKENENRDRIIKRQLYSSWGVSEYWILDPANHTVEVSRKRKEGGLKRGVVLQAEDELTTTLLPGFHIKVAQLFK